MQSALTDTEGGHGTCAACTVCMLCCNRWFNGQSFGLGHRFCPLFRIVSRCYDCTRSYYSIRCGHGVSSICSLWTVTLCCSWPQKARRSVRTYGKVASAALSPVLLCAPCIARCRQNSCASRLPLPP